MHIQQGTTPTTRQILRTNDPSNNLAKGPKLLGMSPSLYFRGVPLK